MYLCRPPGRLLPRVFWLSFLNNWPPSSHYSNWSLPNNPLNHRGTPLISVPKIPLTLFHFVSFHLPGFAFTPQLPSLPLVRYCMGFSISSRLLYSLCFPSIVFNLFSFCVFHLINLGCKCTVLRIKNSPKCSLFYYGCQHFLTRMDVSARQFPLQHIHSNKNKLEFSFLTLFDEQIIHKMILTQPNLLKHEP